MNMNNINEQQTKIKYSYFDDSSEDEQVVYNNYEHRYACMYVCMYVYLGLYLTAGCLLQQQQ